MAVQSVMGPIAGQNGRPGTLGSFLMTTRCGLRVGMEVEGGIAVLSVTSPAVGQNGRSGTPGSFLMTTRCGLRAGMEVGVALPI